MASPPEGVAEAAPPWSCRCEMYWIMLSTGGRPIGFNGSASASSADSDPDTRTSPRDVYAPLEASLWSELESGLGENVHGPAMLQVNRFSQTPVGAYDEMLVIPGFFSTPQANAGKGKDGGKGEGKSHMRVTRAYVSGKATCWNGRRGFGIPKHLAAFEFLEDKEDGGRLDVAVYPPRSDDDPRKKEGAKPFFSARLQRMRYFPLRVPVGTTLFGWLGYSDRLVHPPLPQGGDDGGLLCGTEGKWKSTQLEFKAVNGARLCWVEVGKERKREASEGDALVEKKDGSRPPEVESEGWWPDITPLAWKVGLWLGETELVFKDVVDY